MGGDSLDIVIDMWQEESLEIWDWHHGGGDVYRRAASFFSSMPVKRKVKVKSAYEPNGPSGQSLSWFL